MRGPPDDDERGATGARAVRAAAAEERGLRSRYRVAIVGLGTMGLRHARVFASLPARFEVVGGYDVRRDLAPRPPLTLLRAEAEAIALADVVVVATPIEAHAASVRQALGAGRHVLVEKPLCASAP